MKITFDTLSTINDDELHNMARRFRSKISKITKDRNLTNRDRDYLMRIQTDLCYVQREINIRRSRYDAHKTFLANSL